MEAARAGKDVFCKKPIDAEIPKAREALRAIRETGAKYMIGFNRRFDHNHRRLRQLVADGAVGRPRLIKLTSYDSTYDPDYIRQSARCGGMIFDMSVHDFDAARYLMQAADPGNAIDEVYASGSALLDDPCFKESGDYDTLAAILRFRDGAMAVVHNSREAVYGYDQRIEILGSAGGAVEDNDTPSTVRLYTRNEPTFDRMPWFFTERYAEAFVEELREFFACIREDRPPAGHRGGLPPGHAGCRGRAEIPRRASAGEDGRGGMRRLSTGFYDLGSGRGRSMLRPYKRTG